MLIESPFLSSAVSLSLAFLDLQISDFANLHPLLTSILGTPNLKLRFYFSPSLP